MGQRVWISWWHNAFVILSGEQSLKVEENETTVRPPRLTLSQKIWCDFSSFNPISLSIRKVLKSNLIKSERHFSDWVWGKNVRTCFEMWRPSFTLGQKCAHKFWNRAPKFHFGAKMGTHFSINVCFGGNLYSDKLQLLIFGNVLVGPCKHAAFLKWSLIFSHRRWQWKRTAY